MPLAEARKRREAARELLAQGIDPQHHLQQQKQAVKTDAENTLRSVTDTWFEIKKQKVSENHGKKLYRRLELYLFSDLGEVPISALTAPQVIQVLKPAEAKGNIEGDQLAKRSDDLCSQHWVNTFKSIDRHSCSIWCPREASDADSKACRTP
ncbi:protein of unknown function, might belong to Integrase [Shewanella benthica]|uniref:Phage integrase central domain-containing protein n=1 Tax=Shewanella benthica TaxID=43661 RepID=A0A330M5V0_9GAMM|nr:protein of unknown function, might belong to Integrase [Shewanella benthica]